MPLRRPPSLSTSLILAAAAAIVAAPASAQIPGDPLHLTAVGPVDPQTNYPAWFQDQSGLTLSLCTANNDPAGMCIYDAIDPTTPAFDYQQQIGFNNEAFWWMSDAALDIAPSAECPNCGGALLVLAVEAAFTGTFPNRGDEFTFGRIRIRIDVPVARHDHRTT